MNRKDLDPNSSPTAAFGILVREARESRGWTQDRLSELTGYSSVHISSVEVGRKPPTQRFARKLDIAFGSSDRFEREWQKTKRGALFEGFDEYLRSESEAVALRLFEINIIPSLLQTPEYARAYQEAPVLRGAATQQQADERTDRLLRRQHALAQDPAPLVQAVIDEGALRRPIGGRDVMVAQLKHLEALTAQPRFLVQVCPISSGENRPFAHPITLLTMANRAIVGYGETERRGFLERDPETLAAWTSEYDHLQAEALPRAASREFIRDVRKGYEHG